MEGKKFDVGKIRWGLIPSSCLEQIAKVFTYGAKKYDDHNWKKVEKERYVDALFRHIHAWLKGEKLDEESGLHHLAHAGANILFLLWFEQQEGATVSGLCQPKVLIECFTYKSTTTLDNCEKCTAKCKGYKRLDTGRVEDIYQSGSGRRSE